MLTIIIHLYLPRVRQKEAEEEERSREYMETRMNAILGLKQNIETNKVTHETLRFNYEYDFDYEYDFWNDQIRG